MAKTKAERDEDLLNEIKDNFKSAKKHSGNWRIEARESYDFKAGNQWSETDKAKLEEEGRPTVTFNRMGPYFDAVTGTEINNRQQISYLPRTTGDSKKNEILTQAVRWALDGTDAQFEESDAFEDVLVCGMGWVSTRMDYEDNSDGLICMEQVDPLEMYWPPEAKKRNLKDAKWLMRVKWLSEDEIKERWPDAEVGVSTTLWGDDEQPDPHHANLAFLYRDNNRTGYDDKTGKYRVLQYQHQEHEKVYRVADEQSGKLVTLPEDRFKAVRKAAEDSGIKLNYVKQDKAVHKYCFVIGDEIVDSGDLKCGFTIKAITGKRDRNNNIFYGLARGMKDPQKWANKFLSQIMHIINTNAKGGLLAEEGAFVDPKKAEDMWADPAAVVMLKNGGLGKVKERTAGAYPAGLDKLLQFAIGSIPDVTGVNLEFMGQVDRQQAGILEQERKKSAFIILAGYFDSLRLYRKEQGRLLAHFIKEYMNDGRIIRITTDEGEQGVPLQLTDDMMDYDIIVDEAPNSPNLKEEVWKTLGEFIPQMMKAGIPMPPEVLKFSPLPVDIANAYMKKMQGQLDPQVKAKMDEMQQQMMGLQKENEQLKNQTAIKLQQDATKKELGHAKVAVADQISIRELQAEFAKAEQQHVKDMQKMQAEMENDAAKREQDFQVKVLEAMLKDEQSQKQWAMKQLDAAQKESAKEKPEKEEKSEKPPVINITNVIPKAGDKTIRVKRGKSGSIEGASVSEE
jgi:hypothetical protein